VSVSGFGFRLPGKLAFGSCGGGLASNLHCVFGPAPESSFVGHGAGQAAKADAAISPHLLRSRGSGVCQYSPTRDALRLMQSDRIGANQRRGVRIAAYAAFVWFAQVYAYVNFGLPSVAPIKRVV
jgi:hypothetical protein